MKTRVNEIDLNSRKTGKKDVNELEALENTGAILSRFFFFFSFLVLFYFMLSTFIPDRPFCRIL